MADFGIALALGISGSNRPTETGLSVGTPLYMSPEQATGDQPVGASTDTYALGSSPSPTTARRSCTRECRTARCACSSDRSTRSRPRRYQGRSYDISLDGTRALIIDGGVGTTTALNVVQGWLAEVEVRIQEAEASGGR